MTLSDKRVKTEDVKFNSDNLGVYTGEDITKCIKDIKEELKNPRLDRFSVDKIIDFYIGDALLEKKQRANNRRFCERCRKDSNILQGDFGELLCPKCYQEVTKSELNEEKEEL